MSGMVIGSMIEADNRLRAHEIQVRKAKKLARDAEVWRRYEMEFENRGVPGVGSEAGGAKGKAVGKGDDA